MNLALWIAAGLLAALSAAAGVNKLVNPQAKLLENPQMGWAAHFSQGQIRLIATAELAGALGVLLPQAAGKAEWLTPLAAVGLAGLQAGALVTHLRRGEKQIALLNVALIALALFVAVGRLAGWGD
jgi:hypothetical protein